MDWERTMTLYDESDAHAARSCCLTVDASQISELEQQNVDGWLSSEPRSARRLLPTSATGTTQVVYSNVPLVVEAKEAEDEEEGDSKPLSRRRDRFPVAESFVSSSTRQKIHGGPVTTTNGGGGVRFFQQPAFIPLSVCSPKDEPQTVPCVAATPVTSSKLERKRERNRLAAQKCRHRKVEQISILQERVKTLSQTRVELERTVEELRRQVNLLHQHLRQHVSSGCQLSHGNKA